jgi:DNA polymerase/3'-5' exonuclease PolX
MGIGKIDLNEASAIANSIVDHVSPAMDRIEVAGSIRRRKPVVGDIELVAIPGDRRRLIQLLGEVGQLIKPGVPGVVPWQPKENAKYFRLRMPQGINLDLFCGTRDNWGGLFLMRTGSGVDQSGNSFNGFTPGMFGRWKKLSDGGRMTDCMPTTPDGLQIPLYEEQDFFELLDLNFIPPEARTSKHVIKRYIKQAQ